ncbi:hypothetical protein HMPREF0591_0989 [Mycobacterium parascrofulaceum ATCC BAA-614]|uniref:Uncharacterized protein n=1 Tax=Mycobacterium parascrofulaceum ATCC BAA-614 TaxID=525368 RepID=D5P495_9MYCO|nr:MULTISPECIES: hypothetical protein [Mycobacterium]EFG79092.1 hypothetical protein HMPREF0591_0989 [Mycobacterium parascrofulaceum ATCC BAA-614]OCB31368.1 hypothetical protein A9X02_25325 [Mycobacterium malmoense]
MTGDELDSLYWAPLKDFTAQRTKLTAAAKRRGDDAGAKRISAANKPTTAAWIVNRLALRDTDTKHRLAELGDRLRAAHAEMDGALIRDLSAEQHRLIVELTRAALEAAGVGNPSSAVRDNVTSTLQAAVADPEVRERLGRLTRPEQWSGFGDFGATAPVTSARTVKVTAKVTGKAKGPSTQARAQSRKKTARDTAGQRRREKLTAAMTAAERDKADADAALSERRAQRTAARQRRDEALAALRTAERELERVEQGYDRAEQAARAAEEAVKEAKAQLRRA